MGPLKQPVHISSCCVKLCRCPLTREEAGLEARFGHGVVRPELHPQVVEGGGDALRRVRATEAPVEPGVGQAAPTAHFHVVVLTDLQGAHNTGSELVIDQYIVRLILYIYKYIYIYFFK